MQINNVWPLWPTNTGRIGLGVLDFPEKWHLVVAGLAVKIWKKIALHPILCNNITISARRSPSGSPEKIRLI
jgi:hypothetical protein